MSSFLRANVDGAAAAFEPARPRWAPEDADFVARQRRLRASWQAIAGMMRRAEHDVRLRFDPDYEPARTPAHTVPVQSRAACPLSRSCKEVGRRL